ncbi:unnamed protein product [Ophioblennius macclurei]
MDNPQRRTKNYIDHFRLLPKGGFPFSKYQVLLLCLGLLNVVLAISALVIGINCAKIKQSSLHVSHPAALQLLDQLHNLRSNHSFMIEAEEEVKRDLEKTIQNRAVLQQQLKQKQISCDGYRHQLDALRAERTVLLANISAMESSCGKCVPGFIHFNTSCYFFSYSESSSIKKNWHDSRADCINRGSDLVVIDSPGEQKFISNNIRNLISGPMTWKNGFWVGLTDIETEDRWVWINNVTEVEPRYWFEGEPNNHGAQGEDCALVVHSPSNPWETRFDAKCQQHQIYWLCEMESRHV